MNVVVLTRAQSTVWGALGTIKRIRGVPPGGVGLAGILMGVGSAQRSRMTPQP